MATDPVLAQLEKLNKRMDRIERHMQWDLGVTIARFVVIAVPIVLAFIYIPSFVREYFPQVQSFVLQMQQAAHFIQNISNPGSGR